MKREEIFELIAISEDEALIRLSSKVENSSEVRVLREVVGMVMAQARDSVEGVKFNLGEVLVSEAEVRIDEAVGYSMVLGMKPAKARAGAILDAAIEADHPLRDEIIAHLEEERERLEERRRSLWAAVKRTRVDFEVMK